MIEAQRHNANRMDDGADPVKDWPTRDYPGGNPMLSPTRLDFLRLRAEAFLELFDARPSRYDDPLQARLDGLREALAYLEVADEERASSRAPCP